MNDRIRVVFLDVDGVLNSSAFFKAPTYKESDEPTADEQKSIELLRPHRDIPGEGKNDYSILIDLHHLDPVAIGRLNVLTREPDVRVVVSSVWRHSYSPKGLQLILETQGFVGQVIAKTGQVWGGQRGDEIQNWLQQHEELLALGYTCPPFPGSVESVAILDDDSDMGRWLPRLVKVDNKVGLQESDVARAAEMLREPIG